MGEVSRTGHCRATRGVDGRILRPFAPDVKYNPEHSAECGSSHASANVLNYLALKWVGGLAQFGGMAPGDALQCTFVRRGKDQMLSADVVIIGGGIVGSSIAWHLTEAGCRNVLIVERESHQGKGSTGKSMGGVRAQFATPVNIQMSLYSIPFYASFEERLGLPSEYRPQGYLFVATKPSHLDYLRTNQQLQKSLGLAQALMLTRADIVAIVPQLRSDDVLGGSFCPTDGFVDPYSAMVGFTTRACENGATLWRSTEVTGIAHDGSKISGVETTRGPVSTLVVVNAAGPWAAQTAALAGIKLPVEPLRRMLVPTEPFDGVSHAIPMVVDMTNGFHFRPESRGFLLAWNDPEETPGYKDDFEPFVHREGPGARRRSRALLREPGRESEACLGRPLRDVPRPPRHHRSDTRDVRPLLRQWIQRPWRDACPSDWKNRLRPDSPWWHQRRGRRRGAEPRSLCQGRFAARDGSLVTVTLHLRIALFRYQRVLPKSYKVVTIC